MENNAIKITDILSDERLQEIAEEELRNRLRGYLGNEENLSRVLAHVSYQVIFDEADKTVGNSKHLIEANTRKAIGSLSNYSVFRSGDYGGRKSLAHTIVEQTVSENKQAIKDAVLKTIAEHDYSSEIWDSWEQMGENLCAAIYAISEHGRKKP